MRLHFFAGILVGPFILVAAISGGLYAIAPQIERAVYADALEVPASDTQLTLAEQIEIAEGEIGDGATLSAVRPAPEPGATTRVMFAQEGLGASESRAIFVDPGSGAVMGDMTVYGTSGALPVRTWISQLHRHLHLGEPGRLYSELAASWLGIVAAAGGALWIVRLVRARRRRDLVRPNPKHRGYRRLFGWHASIGIWVLVGALFLSATGITWSTCAGANVSDLRAALSWQTPSASTSLTGDGADPHAHHGGAAHGSVSANPGTFDGVLAIAQRENVDTGLVEIRPPAAEGEAWVVQEVQRSFPTEVDEVAIDGRTMRVVDRVDFDDFPLMAKLARWGVDLHMGSMFGLANQIALLLLAAGIAAMVVLGYAMWWRRRPTHGLASPPARGAVRAAPWWGIAAVAIVAVVVGLFLPLVGWTLVGFLAVDTVLALVARRRTRA
ncbi:PepSY-associated TM helix domain-containing protein [Microbacterium karelineae]|uniref:PepSY-associated TM helix domain-containing protein n=1 Tax=Microbacterium karelineae TaxID=2654283 RepID=UPI0012EA6344|nr:PepSY-associated TM helix domain-containing protein [Microbacterium karelineae]